MQVGYVLEKLIRNIASLLNEILNIQFYVYGIPIRLLYFLCFFLVIWYIVTIIRSVG